MKRLALLGLGVFLLSLGGTTGTLMLKARHSPADSTKARAGGATVAGDSARAAPGIAPGTVASVDSSIPADTAVTTTPKTDTLASTPAPTAPPSRPTAAAAAPAAASATREEAAYKQLARIFANMKTTDAAKVLGYMSDEEVQGVLQQLGVRPAAGLLAALPKERAAVLSRRLLTGGDRTVVAP